MNFFTNVEISSYILTDIGEVGMDDGVGLNNCVTVKKWEGKKIWGKKIGSYEILMEPFIKMDGITVCLYQLCTLSVLMNLF